MTTAHRSAFEVVARVPVDPGMGQVYEMGWQSWSPSSVYPVTATSARPVGEFYQIFYRPETPAPAVGFQGEGLLAVDPGPGGPVRVFGAADGRVRVPSVRARLDGDVLEVSADGPVEQTTGDDGADLYSALARFADRYVARVGGRMLPDVPPIWASWYQYFTAFTQRDLAVNLDAMDRLELDVGIVRLDDAFQAGIGDWLTPSTGFDSLDGMVRRVLDRGRRVGLWNAPFLVGSHSRTFAEHPDWLVRDDAGAPVRAHFNWGQDCHVLDTTHPGAADFLREVFTTYREWGTTYYMVDFLYAGALPGRRYADVDAVTAYRDALALIRETIGEDAVLQGCGAPMFPSVGYVDTMRVGADIAPHYPAHHDELGNPGGESALVSTVGRAFTQGRFWINDPDCLVARPGIERREQWADVVERYGGIRISSDGLDQLDEWGLETTRRLLVPARKTPFEENTVPLEHPAAGVALAGRSVTGRPGAQEQAAEMAAARAAHDAVHERAVRAGG